MRALEPPSIAVAEAVQRALDEDLTPLGDLSSALLPDDAVATAELVAREPGVLAGRACATETFRRIDPTVALDWTRADGADLEVGTVLATVVGPLAAVVTAERTALNFLGHLSGIATLTRTHVLAAAGGGSARVWDTRKTTPGLRALEKAAVRAGGGVNHRGNLSDWVMLKDNHLTRLGIGAAVAAARERWPGRTVQVECDRMDQVIAALEAEADALLLDNMTPAEVRLCVSTAEDHATVKGGRRPLLEVSGGVTLATIAAYAGTGADLISVGALTNSAPVLDIGLDIH